MKRNSMMRSRKYPDYEARFCRFSNSIEKGLSTLLGIFLILLICSQIFLSIDDHNMLKNQTEKLEGSVATF